MLDLFAMLRALRAVVTALFAAAAANVILLAFLDRYDVRLGPLHLAASYLFKPLMYLNAAFLLAIALGPAPETSPAAAQARPPRLLGVRFWLAALAIMAAVYSVSFGINLEDFDWTHRWLMTDVSALSFFTKRQYDGFYRPLTFLSLWLDNRVFGEALWGYHIQNILIHLLNGALVARLACRLRLSATAARWSGLLFLALPAGFEAVIWPGARFDLLAATFTLIALDRALAGSVALSTAAYVLGVLSKESAYCYPLILGALYLLRPLAPPLERARMLRILFAAAAATVVLIGMRIAVYGNLGGYPLPEAGKTVHFAITAKTFTSIPTRLPAALYLVNSNAGVTVWLRIALIVYAGALAAALASGARLGARAALLLLPFLAVIPTLNVIGWLNQSAQGGRYLYQPAIWIVFAVAWALTCARRGPLLAATLTVSMAAAALFNTLAYVRMLRTAGIAVSSAAALCRNAPCCRTLHLRDLPGDLYGAYHFGYQVRWNLRKALPGVVLPAEDSPGPGPCAVDLHWTAQHTWTVGNENPGLDLQRR